MMNQSGQILPIIAFICAILLAALFIVIAEPAIDAILDTVPALAPEGGSVRLIIFGASLLIVLAGLWFLTHPREVRYVQ